MADLPGGTVALLFTGIAESTALWQRDPTGMRQAVHKPLALVRRVLLRHCYPPDKQEDATELVIEQAELMSSEQAA
jgi:hypothetical protein